MRTKITNENGFIQGLTAAHATHLVVKPFRRTARSSTAAVTSHAGTHNLRQFKVKPRYGEALAGGWYLFELDLRSLDQPLLWAAFYADYKRGINEESYLPLPLKEVAPGRYLAIARFTHRLIGLRLDVVAHRRFELDHAQLRKLGKLEAASRMLFAVVQSAATLKKKLWVTLSAMLRLGFSGQRSFATWLYREYSENAQTPLSGRYLSWVRLYGNAIPADIKSRLNRMDRKPLISVAISTCNTDEASLRQCMLSMIAQHYPPWELCIADNASDQPHIRALLNEFSQLDTRITCTFLQQRGDYSTALNCAIEHTHGNYIAIVKEHDELHPLAFFQVALEVCKHPEWKIIYTDEDKIDHRRIRFDPDFKPDWNYELLLAQNYIRHLCIFDSALVKTVGGFRQGFHGCEDYDFLLRCIEHTGPAQIGHIASALYHEHAVADAPASPENHVVHSNGTRALQQHLQRVGVCASVTTAADGIHRIRFACPQPAPYVSLIVPTRDKVRLLRSCLDSISKSTYSNYEIIVVDNRSTDSSTLRYLDKIARMPHVQVLRYNAPFNYSAINNFAERHARGDIIGLVNNDIEIITPDWMEEMVSHAMRPHVGAVGAMLYYPDGTIQHAGVIVGLGGVAGHAYLHMPRGYGGSHNRGLSLQNLSAVTAACMLVRRETFHVVGGLDESLEVAFNDVDFCLRLRDAGYRNVWTPYAQMYHMESASRGADATPEQQDRFQRELEFMRARWGAGLLKDPAYNANLSLSSHCFDLAFPPRH
ncbi:glycosyltransferase family 2 protein [Dyella silvatica]|uniref:glycosyltransferase family 2 protein n=1 Tax=Dyella silvatica TaxID=2992128 RepID=UPI002254E564|nr:glycosyltransferase family 2 protein [Dyella silvatica]